MQGDRENIVVAALIRGGRQRVAQCGSRRGWQDVSLMCRMSEDGGSTVSLMHIAIDGHRLPNKSALLHDANRDRDVVDHAETFAVIREGVMESAADVHANAVREGSFGGKNR